MAVFRAIAMRLFVESGSMNVERILGVCAIAKIASEFAVVSRWGGYDSIKACLFVICAWGERVGQRAERLYNQDSPAKR